MIGLDVHRDALKKLGFKENIRQCLEELNELEEELVNVLVNGSNSMTDNFKGELADVTNCIIKLCLIFDISERDLKAVQVKKMKKLREALKKII